jgi:hypothetical protein
MWTTFKEWVYQVFIAIDQLANTLLLGSADETISSRCYRLNHIKAYRAAEIFVNCLFFPFQGWNHCKNAYIKEVLGRQLPYEFFDLALEMNLRYDSEKLGDKVEMPK